MEKKKDVRKTTGRIRYIWATKILPNLKNILQETVMSLEFYLNLKYATDVELCLYIIFLLFLNCCRR
jgi:hypothetical protein